MAPLPALSPRCWTGNVNGAGRGIKGEGPCFFHTLRKFLHRVRSSALRGPGAWGRPQRVGLEQKRGIGQSRRLGRRVGRWLDFKALLFHPLTGQLGLLVPLFSVLGHALIVPTRLGAESCVSTAGRTGPSEHLPMTSAVCPPELNQVRGQRSEVGGQREIRTDGG